MQFTKDQRQAAIDALMDLIHGRNDLGGGGGMPPIQGDVTIPIDPRLNKPQSLTGDMSNMNINDPDGVLNKIKPTFIDNQMPQNQQSSGNGNQQQNGSQQDPGQSGDSGQQGGSQGAGDQQDGDQGDGGQNGNSQGNQQGQGNQQNGQSGNGNGQDKNGQNQQGQNNQGSGNGNNNKPAEDYIEAWNDIMTRFDRDEIDKAELVDLMNRIKSGEISY